MFLNQIHNYWEISTRITCSIDICKWFTGIQPFYVSILSLINGDLIFIFLVAICLHVHICNTIIFIEKKISQSDQNYMQFTGLSPNLPRGRGKIQEKLNISNREFSPGLLIESSECYRLSQKCFEMCCYLSNKAHSPSISVKLMALSMYSET